MDVLRSHLDPSGNNQNAFTAIATDNGHELTPRLGQNRSQISAEASRHRHGKRRRGLHGNRHARHLDTIGNHRTPPPGLGNMPPITLCVT